MYSGTFEHSPFFWAVVSGLLLGIAVRYATSRRFFAFRRWTIASFAVAIAVAAALLGVFIPGPQYLCDIRLAYCLGAAGLLGYLIFRFPGAAGVPVFSVVAFLSFVFILGLQPYRVVRGEEPIGEFAVLSTTAEATTIETDWSEKSPFITVPSDSLFIEIAVLRAAPYFFFIGFRTKVSALLYKQDDVFVRIPSIDVDSSLAAFAARVLLLLPGIEVEKMRSSEIQLRELFYFRISARNHDRIDVFMSVAGAGSE